MYQSLLLIIITRGHTGWKTRWDKPQECEAERQVSNCGSRGNFFQGHYKMMLSDLVA
jgi:hypothetical protein